MKFRMRMICAALATILSIGMTGLASVAGASESETFSYPMQTDVTLTYWTTLNGNIASSHESLADTPFAKALQEQTGVNLKFIHPASGQGAEQFNLLLASGDLPDLIEYEWLDFAGGPEKAIEQEFILELNDVFEKYAPNLTAYLEQNPDLEKQMRTDQGKYYSFPFVRGDDILMVANGPMMRKDWLDDLNMEIPTTIDEWYDALTAFKNEKGAEKPLSFANYNWILRNGVFIGAFGINKEFYQDEGVVKYGPMQPEYKDFLMTFHKWYDEGILDNDLFNLDSKQLDANITGGLTAATVGFAGSAMGKWIRLMEEIDPDFELIAMPHPTLNKGETARFGQRDFAYSSRSTVITTDCKNVEIAARFLDYGYSPEGHMLFNFGIEDESYNIIDDYPTYSEIVTQNPDGLSMSQSGALYCRAFYDGPFVQDRKYIEQFYSLQAQKDALPTWMNTDAEKYMMPRISALPEESSEVAGIMNEVQTYVDEMMLKFIMGVESIEEEYENYVSQIEKMGIQTVITSKQNALDRYNQR